MELSRSGANRFHGWTKLFSKGFRYSWDAQNGKVVLDIPQVSDGVNTFNYRVSLDLEELTTLVDLLATTGIDKSYDKVSDALEESVGSLTRLAGVASGLSVTQRSARNQKVSAA